MSARFVIRAAAALLAAAASSPLLAADVAFTNATVVIGDGSAPVEHGTVVLRDGKVLAAGANVPVPAGATVVDAAGKWVTPGLVIAVTDLGLLDVGAVSDSNDTQADKSVFNAALDVSTAIDPEAIPLEVSRAGGVTRAAVLPLAWIRRSTPASEVSGLGMWFMGFSWGSGDLIDCR